MAARPIITYENPRLRMKSIKVKRIDHSIQTLIDDMIDTMRQANGIGLAAPQVGVLLRVIVAEYTEEDEEEAGAQEAHQTVLINPEIAAKEGEWLAEEGCLSIPGYVGTVARAERVTVRGKDRAGKPVRLKTEGRLAHILQHEIDHLDGVLYIDYLNSLDELRPVEPGQRRRRRRAGESEDREHEEDEAEESAAPSEPQAVATASSGEVLDPCCAARGEAVVPAVKSCE